MRIVGFLKKFDKSVEAEFKDFQIAREITTLRLTCNVAIIYTALLAWRDYYVATNIQTMLVLRICMVLVLVGLTIVTFQKQSIRSSAQYYSMAGLFVYTLLAILLHHTVNSPEFFLPNVFVLLAFITGVGLGLSFTKMIVSNTILLLLYTIYSTFISDSVVLKSQVLNVFISFTLASVIGFYFERENRVNFYQRKKLMAANDALDKANATKNKLLSMLSHDLNAPLSNLASVLNLKEQALISDEELLDLKHKIRLNLESSSALLSNITRWSKTQREGFEPDKVLTNAKQLVKEVVQSFGSLPDSKQLIIECEISEELFFNVDKEMVKCVFRNIIGNSIKFSESKKSILVEARQLENLIEFSISDEGVGMSPQLLNNLFTSSVKSSPGTYNEKGHGLGLQMANDFVKMHGGHIEAKSEQGKGSTFVIYLPI